MDKTLPARCGLVHEDEVGWERNMCRASLPGVLYKAFEAGKAGHFRRAVLSVRNLHMCAKPIMLSCPAGQLALIALE